MAQLPLQYGVAHKLRHGTAPIAIRCGAQVVARHRLNACTRTPAAASVAGTRLPEECCPFLNCLRGYALHYACTAVSPTVCHPQVAGALEGQFVVSVAAGREHALAVTKEGLVFSWGGRRDVAGRVGQLNQPAPVSGDLAGDKIKLVAAGEVSRCGCVRGGRGVCV